MTLAEFYVLTILTTGERHGYALIAETIETSRGQVVLQSGTLYRMLERFEKDGLIEAVASQSDDARRRYYRATEAGTKAAQAHLEMMRDAVHFATDA